MNYSLRLLPTGAIEVPYPEVFWMEKFQEWTRLEFQMAVMEGGGHTIVVNTGFPDEIEGLARAWRDFLGDRAKLQRPEGWKPRISLPSVGIDPAKVDYVILTPLQLYATGNLRLFSQAKICLSRRGWIEDIIAPTYPHHVPRAGCISDSDLLWLMGENNRNLVLLDDLHELLPGMTCRWVGVHHRSTLMVEAQTARGLAILSDCAFHFANVEEERPIGIAESIIEAHAAYRDIRRRAKVFIPLYEPLVHRRFPGGVVA